MQRKDYDECKHGDAQYKTHVCECPQCEAVLVTDMASIRGLNSGPGGLGIVLGRDCVDVKECRHIRDMDDILPDLVRRWLQDNGYDGLYWNDGEACGCSFKTGNPSDWLPCVDACSNLTQCQPAKLHRRDDGTWYTLPPTIEVKRDKVVDWADEKDLPPI
jgi:hypothetical protein